MNRSLLFLPCALLLVGCGAEPTEKPSSGPVPIATGSASTGSTPDVTYLLTADIPGTVPVLAALQGAEGQEIAVTGRLQKKVKGRALFYLTDDSVAYCGRGSEKCGCKTPWDYCCELKSMKAGTIVVELRGADGKPAPVADLGLRELDLVAVKGTLTKGDGGRLMLLAKDGWYLRDRPALPSGLKWPQ